LIEEIDVEGEVGEMNRALGDLDVELVNIDVAEYEIAQPLLQ